LREEELDVLELLLLPLNIEELNFEDFNPGGNPSDRLGVMRAGERLTGELARRLGRDYFGSVNVAQCGGEGLPLRHSTLELPEGLELIEVLIASFPPALGEAARRWRRSRSTLGEGRVEALQGQGPQRGRQEIALR
jgi:hypothetical protein